MLDWIIEGIRVLIWGLVSACLMLMDVSYDIVVEVASVDFLSDPNVWNWYSVMMLFLGLCIATRTLAVFFKFAFDEEYRDKVSVSNFFNKIISIVFVVALLPQVLGFVGSTASWAVQNTSIVLGTNANTKPSTLVLTAFMNRESGEYDKNGNWVPGEKVTYTIEDIDINEDGEGDDDYKFFNGISDLFMVAIIGIAAAVMLIMNAVQIGRRIFGLVMKLLVAPLPISSLIVPGDETFSMWRKMIISDYLLNFFQTLMIMIVVILSGSKIIADLSVWAQIILFIAGLLMLLSGIPELSKILGGDTSQGGVFQQLASIRMSTRGVGSAALNTAKSIGGGVASLGTGMGATGAYGLGRFLGGRSIADMASKPFGSKESRDSNGFMGGSNVQDGTSNFASTPGKSNNASARSNMNNSQSMYMNNDQVNNNMENSTQSNKDNVFSAAANGGSNGNGPTERQRYSNPETFASNLSNRAASATGLKGAAANFAVNSSRHMYQNSMKRIERSKAYRVSASAYNLSRPSQGGTR